jgi:intracellular sulfur oxidation DsrE/DsrF family protein
MKFYSIVAGLLMLMSQLSAAEPDKTRLQQMLSAAQAPDGVVFEIMAWEDNSWDWAVPMLRHYVDQLRAKYPGLDMALISHGAELFDLRRGAALQDRSAIRQLAVLGEQGVAVHVCGEYAKWKRLGPRDFLEFVDVADSGSAQLANYIELGFEHIKLEPPHGIN